MQPVAMGEVEAELRLDASISGLADRMPQMSARTLLSRGQRNVLIGLLAAVVIGLVLNALETIIVVIACFTLMYLIAVVYRVLPLHTFVEERCPRDRQRRGGPRRPRLRVALLHDPAPSLTKRSRRPSARCSRPWSELDYPKHIVSTGWR